jgi:hypothetical protein
MMNDGYWVVSVDRESGRATTEFVADSDEAWQHSIDIETPAVYTTVVQRRIPRERKRT